MNEPSLVKKGIRLNQDDVDAIQEAYPEIGYSKIIRHFVRRLAQNIREGRANALNDLKGELLDE